MSIKVAFVGSGNLAHGLAPALQAGGLCEVVQVFSRNNDSARLLAERLGVEAYNLVDDFLPEVRLIFLAVRDDALPEMVNIVAHAKRHKDCTVVHSAGSAPLSTLSPLDHSSGVFYPLQTFSMGRILDLSNVPIFLEGDEDALGRLKPLAESISRDVRMANSEERMHIHIGAVFASNFVNWMIQCAEKVGGSFEVYRPLLSEVVAKLNDMAPIQAQTGPARRHDSRVLFQHLEVIKKHHPELAELYETLSHQIGQAYSD
jgi:predicted short-subunit dehydrogenase-like oxidoreductase (DUF2520 family)